MEEDELEKEWNDVMMINQNDDQMEMTTDMTLGSTGFNIKTPRRK